MLLFLCQLHEIMAIRGYFSGDCFFEPPGFAQGFAQQKLDLPVQAPQIVVGPTAHLIEQLRVDPQWKVFSHGRRGLTGGALVVHRAGV